jgi:hypothetical protein
MRQVAQAGRWAWGLCGLITAAAIAVPGTLLIVSAGGQAPAKARAPHAGQLRMVQTQTRTVTVQQPITSLSVQDYAGLIQVTAAAVSHVEVTEMLAYFGRPPTVAQSVSGGLLSLADPACANLGCAVSFAVKVPAGVTVTAAGGAMFIAGIAGANLDSDGAPVRASDIDGPLTVSTHGGSLLVNGLTGPLRADTGGGPVVATGLTGATAAVSTGSGSAQIAFAAAPESVTVSTVRSSVSLAVPGGPYALTANSDGAAQIIGIATSSAADRSITVSTGGGQLVISSRDPGNQLDAPPLSTSSRGPFQFTTLDPARPLTRKATVTVRPAGWLSAIFPASSMVLSCAAGLPRPHVAHESPALRLPRPGPDVVLCGAH